MQNQISSRKEKARKKMIKILLYKIENVQLQFLINTASSKTLSLLQTKKKVGTFKEQTKDLFLGVSESLDALPINF